MRNLRFQKLLLWSGKERKAKKIVFHPSTTVILGENNTGKSSLIKSIYYTLGADVAFHPKWEDANVASLLEIELDGDIRRVLRFKRLIAIFNQRNELIFTCDGIGNSVRFFSDWFRFQLPLKESSSGHSKTAYPAFQYLPFYLDQDRSWTRTWNSFEGLTQFSNWARDLIDYHVGIKPSRWYALTEQINLIRAKVKERETEQKHLINAQAKLNETQHQNVTFDLDLATYQDEINRLLKQCDKLKQKQDTFRSKLFHLRNKERHFLSQIEIVQVSIKEFEKDQHYATRTLMSDHIECPTCGTDFDNSMINRFSLVEDAEVCRQLLLTLNEQVHEVRKSILPVEEEFMNAKNESEKIEAILQEKKGALNLRDIIRSESQKEVRSVLQSSIQSYSAELFKLSENETNLMTERKFLVSADRTKEIRGSYNAFMRKFLFDLKVQGLSESDYRDLPTKVKEMGSDQPRAILAYSYAILHTMLKHSDGVFFPIVLDSPNQQDQDETNVRGLMDFSFKQRPLDSQLILGSVELHGATHQGTVIELKDPYSVLSLKEFDEVDSVVHPLVDMALLNVGKQTPITGGE